MSVSVLKNRTEIQNARAEICKRGINILDNSFKLEFASKGYIEQIGDMIKSWDVIKTIDFLEQHVPNSSPILDIGAFCSEIPCVLHLLKYSNIFGIDLNPDVVRMPYGATIHYSVANFMNTVFPDSSFSAITAISVIEHGFDGEKLAIELSRILKPGGYFIASVDYWKNKISTSGLTAFGMDWTIFSKDELIAFFDSAARYGLYPIGKMDFDTEEKPVSWNNREYTFAWFVLRKSEKNVDLSHYVNMDNKTAGQTKDKLAFLSTYNQPCGIATHTRFVIEGIKKRNNLDGNNPLEILVFAEDVHPIEPDEPWVLRSWTRFNDDFDRTRKLLLHHGITIFHIQFQIGLYVATDILGLTKFCHEMGIRVYITFHSSENGLPLCSALVNLATMSFVHLEQSAVRFVAFGADASKIQKVPHGIHNDRPHIPKEVARQKLGLPQNIKLVTSFGFFEQHKGVYEIISALPAIMKRHPETAFIFLGGPQNNNPQSVTYVNRCEQQANQLGINEKVIFATAFLPDELVSLYLFASDVIIMNYLPIRNEISGAASFALAHQRPLISSATPAFSQLTECTFQLSMDMSIETAICLILENTTFGDYLVSQARKHMSQWSYEVLGKTLLKAYKIQE